MRGRDWFQDDKIADERLNWIWALADQTRNEGGVSVERIAALARTRGTPLSWREVRYLAVRDARADRFIFWPDFLVEFLVELLSDRLPQKVLDVAAGTGALLCGLGEAGLEGELVGLVRGPETLKTIAEEGAQSAPNPVFVHGGLSSLPGAGQWDLILAPVLVHAKRNRWEHGVAPRDDHGGSFDEATIAMRLLEAAIARHT